MVQLAIAPAARMSATHVPVESRNAAPRDADARKIIREDPRGRTADGPRYRRDPTSTRSRRKLRKKVEMLFAHLKRILGLRTTCDYEGQSGARRRIPPRRHRPEPPQTGEDLSCTAANAQSLTRKAHTPRLRRHFLRQQYVVFPQNRRKGDFRYRCEYLVAKTASRHSLRSWTTAMPMSPSRPAG